MGGTFEKHIWIEQVRTSFGGISVDDNLIYITQYNGTTLDNLLVAYDFNGNLAYSVPFTYKNEPEGAFVESGIVYGAFNEGNTAFIVKATPTQLSKIAKVDVATRYYPF